MGVTLGLATRALTTPTGDTYEPEVVESHESTAIFDLGLPIQEPINACKHLLEILLRLLPLGALDASELTVDGLLTSPADLDGSQKRTVSKRFSNTFWVV